MKTALDIAIDPAQGRTAEAISNMRGALWMLVSCVAATVMSVGVKLLAGEVSTVQTVFLRNVFGVVIVLPFVLASMRGIGGHRAEGQRTALRFSKPWLHLLRGGLFVVAVTSGFYALSKLPLATATALFFLAPIFATALSALLTGEEVGPRRWFAVAAAFIGAMIVLRPGFVAFELATLAAVVSSICFASSLVITRPIAESDGALSMMISANVIAALVLLIPALRDWMPVSSELWPALALVILGSSARFFADIRAYSIAEAGFLAPFAFLRMIFIVAAGWFLFAEGIDGPTLTGATVIIGSAVFIARREAQLRRIDQQHEVDKLP